MAESFGIACHELVSRDFRCGSNSEVRRCHRERPLLGQQQKSISVIPGPEGVEKSWREAEPGAVDDGAFVYWLWRGRERLARPASAGLFFGRRGVYLDREAGICLCKLSPGVFPQGVNRRN